MKLSLIWSSQFFISEPFERTNFKILYIYSLESDYFSASILG
jgi:hypothetical protein